MYSQPGRLFKAASSTSVFYTKQHNCHVDGYIKCMTDVERKNLCTGGFWGLPSAVHDSCCSRKGDRAAINRGIDAGGQGIQKAPLPVGRKSTQREASAKLDVRHTGCASWISSWLERAVAVYKTRLTDTGICGSTRMRGRKRRTPKTSAC